LRVLRVVFQVVLALAAAGFAWYLYSTLITNLRRAGLPTGFEFLDQPFGVNIPQNPFPPGGPVWRALVVGVKNTLALVVVGLPLLTVVGVVVGVARLATNWLVRKAAAVYVETLRNLPPLLIIFFAFNAVILQLPRPTQAATPLDWFVISNLALYGPGVAAQPSATQLAWVAAAGLVVAALVWRWRTGRNLATGEPHHRVAWSLGVLAGIVAVAYVVLGFPIGLSRPQIDGRLVTGGFGGLGAYFAVLAALVLYTASHVAEIVRGSIQAVPKGQTEAAEALALSSFQRLRFVILPQAFRIAIPPTINQYLNYTKNTSLAIAVGYAEITRLVFQTIGNGQPAPQLIAILMLVYLSFSLTISALVNVVNRRLQLVER
jgi:general L-amino acid transport system permease protein